MTSALTRNNFTADCPVSTDSSLSTGVTVILYMITSVVTLFTVCGNLLVIICVCRFKQLHTPTNVLILSLASSDFLVGLFLTPLICSWIIETCWIFGAVLCALFYFASFQLTCQSVHNVTLLAIDRYIALSNPFFYVEKATVNVSVAAASLSWLFSIVYCFALLYNIDLFSDSACVDSNLVSNEIWAYFDIVVVFILPCTVMIVLYCRIFAIAKRHADEIGKVNSMQPEAKNSEHKAAKTIGILMIVFLLCLMPFYLSSSMGSVIDDETMKMMLLGTCLLFYLNSFFNPIIYALYYPWFQKSIKIIFTFNGFSMASSNVMY